MKFISFVFFIVAMNTLQNVQSQKLKQVPVLCYHAIRESGNRSDYKVSVHVFKAQLKILAENGYHSIVPAQLQENLSSGKPLPSNPVMFTFDDTRIEHYTVAAPEMEKYGFKGVFFIMTICIGKPGYMTAEQIKTLAEKGHIVGFHSWDHQDVRKLQNHDWVVQLDKPKANLEKLIGKPVFYYAYPYGAWNEDAITRLKSRGIKAAFQLSGKLSEKEPLFTIRRIIVPGSWSAKQLQTAIKTSFD